MKETATPHSIIVTGSMSWDTIMDFPSRFVDHLNPERLHQINVSFVVDSLEKQIGGTATNIAYAASQTFSCLKKEGENVSVNVVGGLGKDAQGHLKFFRKHHIDTSRIIIDRRMYSAAGSVITDTKDNQIWGFYYGASAAAKRITLESFNPRDSIIIVSANHPEAFIHFQKEAVRLGIPYMYDPGMALSWISDRDLANGVMRALFLIGNDYEIAMVLKRIKRTIKQLNDNGVQVITTLGERGVTYQSRMESYTLPAINNIKAVDPTGAGDAFRGGFLAAYAKGLSLNDCLAMGNTVASFAVEHYGCVNYHITATKLKSRVTSLGSRV